MSGKRPFKVWNSSHTIKKSVVVSDLNELIEIGSDKLGLSGEVKVFLAEDDTEVDDQEYFRFLRNNTVLILRSESAEPEIKVSVDVPDCSANFASARLISGNPTVKPMRSIPSLIILLKRDINNFLMFNHNELMTLIDLNTEEFSSSIGLDIETCENLQMTLLRKIDKDNMNTDALEILNLMRERTEVRKRAKNQ